MPYAMVRCKNVRPLMHRKHDTGSLAPKSMLQRLAGVLRGIVGSLLKSCRRLCVFATFYEEVSSRPSACLGRPFPWAW